MSAIRAYGKHRKQSVVDEALRRKRWSMLGGQGNSPFDQDGEGDKSGVKPEPETESDSKSHSDSESEMESGNETVSRSARNRELLGSPPVSPSPSKKRAVRSSLKKTDGSLKKLKSELEVQEVQEVEERIEEVKLEPTKSSKPQKPKKPRQPGSKETPVLDRTLLLTPPPKPPPATPSPSHLSAQENDAWGFFDDIVNNSPKKPKQILSVDISLNLDEDNTSRRGTSKGVASVPSDGSPVSLVRKSPQKMASHDSSTMSSFTSSTASIPGSPRATKRISSQVNTRRTYGKARRYATSDNEDAYDYDNTGKSDNDDDNDNENDNDKKRPNHANQRLNLGFLSRLTDKSDIYNENDDSFHDDDIDLKNFDELRAHGVNTHFINDVQFIIESFQEGCNNKNLTLQRSSLLQLASKTLDRDFIIGFKSTNFPMILLNNMEKSVKDDYSSFLFGVILCRLLEEGGVGIGLSVAQNKWIINLLVMMVGDREDILNKNVVVDENEKEDGNGKSMIKPTRVKKPLKKKKRVSPFQTSLAKFIQTMDSSLPISSRSLVALSVFISLEKLGARTNNMMLDQLMNHVDDFLLASQELMDELFFDNSSETQKDELTTDCQLQLLYMIMVQLDYLADGDESGSVLKNINSSSSGKLPPIVYALTLSERFIKGENNASIKKLKNFTITTLRILITLISNATTDDIKQIYDGGLAEGLANFVSNRNSNEFGYEGDDEIYLYSTGLLLNLVDSHALSRNICSMLLGDVESLSQLKASVFESPQKSKKMSEIEIHIQGCEYLVLGLLAVNEQIRGNRERYFSEHEIDLLRKGLGEFENRLSNRSEQVLQQIESVLNQL